MAAASTKAERAAAREAYCKDKLVPVLQEMVMQMLKVLPDDPEDYMRSWLDEQIVKEGAPEDFTPAPMVFAAPPPVPDAEPEPIGNDVEIEGEIVPEEEATRLSTLTQLIADTPGAARATWFSVRGSVVPLAKEEEVKKLSVASIAEISANAPEPKLSTLSQVIADTPGAARTTVVTVRGTVVPEDQTSKLSTWSQVIADTPGAAPRWVTVRATVTEEEAKRLSEVPALTVEETKKLSTMSALIADTPGAARATEISRASAVVLRGTVVQDDGLQAAACFGAPPAAEEPVTVVGNILPEKHSIVEQNRLSTLTQLINNTPGAARGTLMTIRASAVDTGRTTVTPEDEKKMSTLSQVIADTPGAARGTVVTVRGTIKSRPGSTVTAQVVVPYEEAKKLSTLSQVMTDTPGGSRATMVTVRGTVIQPEEGSKLSTMSALIADTPGAARGTVASTLTSVLGGGSK